MELWLQARMAFAVMAKWSLRIQLGFAVLRQLYTSIEGTVLATVTDERKLD